MDNFYVFGTHLVSKMVHIELLVATINWEFGDYLVQDGFVVVIDSIFDDRS